MPRVHIAYIKRDLEAAEYLALRLTKLRFDVSSMKELPLSPKDEADIKQNDACILLLSLDSVRDKDLQELAKNHRNRISIRLKSTEWAKIPSNSGPVVLFQDSDKIISELKIMHIRQRLPYVAEVALILVFIILLFLFFPKRNNAWIENNDFGSHYHFSR